MTEKSGQSDPLYRELILDHYKNPRNFGTLKDAASEAEDSNPLCGDEIKIGIKVKDSKIADVKYVCSGCAISTAGAYLLSEYAKGKRLDDVRRLDRKFILKMLGINPGPARIKCALLPLKALKLAIYSYLGLKFKGTLGNP